MFINLKYIMKCHFIMILKEIIKKYEKKCNKIKNRF